MSTAEGVGNWRTVAWAILAVAGIVLWGVLLGRDGQPGVWRALLVNFLFFTSLAGGMAVWPAIVRACNGKWHREIEHVAAAGVAFAVPSVTALVVLWIGSHHWAPWYDRAFHQGIWLHNGFVFGRDLVALLLFWGVALRYLSELRKGQGMVTGGILIALYAIVFSLLGIDLVMALDPEWYSTLAGGYFFMSGLYIAITCWGFLACFRKEATADQRQDLGRLMVAFSLMTTYLMYAHLLPIWYEVLPKEVRFVVPRMNFVPGKTVSMVLLATVYFGPLVLLLMERAKRSRGALGAITLLVLVGMWVERWWLVVPTFGPNVRFGMAEVAMAAGMAGLLGLGMEWFHTRRFSRS